MAPGRETIGVAQPCVMRGAAPGQLFGLSAINNEWTQANERARGPEAQRVTTLATTYNQCCIQRYKAAPADNPFNVNTELVPFASTRLQQHIQPYLSHGEGTGPST